MKKKATTNAKKATSLRLRKETLHCLEASQLQRVAGGGRVRITIPFADDTTPIDDDTAG